MSLLERISSCKKWKTIKQVISTLSYRSNYLKTFHSRFTPFRLFTLTFKGRWKLRLYLDGLQVSHRDVNCFRLSV